eukprot:scaffold276161_cov38-Tisochrysis_lutea.AAC.2
MCRFSRARPGTAEGEREEVGAEQKELKQELKSEWQGLKDRVWQDTNSKPWLRLIDTHGHSVTVDRMCAFYGNIALISALFAGFTVTLILEPPEELRDNPAMHASAGAIGVASFILLLASTIDCILIDNTVKMIVTERDLLCFFSAHGFLLRIPTTIFIVCVGLALVHMGLVILSTYGLTIGLVHFISATVIGGALLYRFKKLSMWLDFPTDERVLGMFDSLFSFVSLAARMRSRSGCARSCSSPPIAG